MQLLDVQKQLEDTGEAIQRTTAEIVKHPTYPSLVANLRSLEKRFRTLEEQFAILSSRQHLDVCSYRMFKDDAQPKVKGFANALADFQKLFSLVYESVKSQTRRDTARVSMDAEHDTALTFGYTFSGSLGVVLTLPNDRLLIGATKIDESMRRVFDLASARTSDEIALHARELGAAPIRALYTWADHHVDAELGADIQWLRSKDVKGRLFIQQPEIEELRRAIAQTSDETVEQREYSGLLVGGDLITGRFHLELDSEESIRGTMEEGLTSLTLGQRYRALIRQTSRIIYSTEEPEIKNHLVSLTRV